jgi:hypothetical protein
MDNKASGKPKKSKFFDHTFSSRQKKKGVESDDCPCGKNWHPPHAWKPMGKLPTRIAQFLETTAL